MMLLNRKPKLARTLSENITGSCGMMEIFWRSCFKCVVLVGFPSTNSSPDIPLLIRNNAESRLLFPAPVLPTFITFKKPLYNTSHSLPKVSVNRITQMYHPKSMSHRL